MQAPWQDLLHWWFGEGVTASEIAAERHRLWFGYRAEQDEAARTRFGDQVEQAAWRVAWPTGPKRRAAGWRWCCCSTSYHA